jgi:monoterpene epsilon-lactone hydrolase
MGMAFEFTGPIDCQGRSLASAARAVLDVSARRLLRGPRRPAWGWELEVRTEVLRRQLRTAFGMRDINQARACLDSIVARASARVRTARDPDLQGYWCVPANVAQERTVLYLHGGGYSFYPRVYVAMVAQIALAAKSKTFALDYRLAPEHRFPAQLQDALSAYRRLLQTDTDPGSLVVAGDSAGGNLALALLLAARDAHLPMPALAVLISPATDFRLDRLSPQDCDWIDPVMLARWAGWFCGADQRCDPLISPACADLRGLPPMYVQAGGCEILYPSIRAFVQEARRQSVDATLDTWEEMNHDFLIFGPDIPQSGDALRRLAAAIDLRLSASRPARATSVPEPC